PTASPQPRTGITAERVHAATVASVDTVDVVSNRGGDTVPKAKHRKRPPGGAGRPPRGLVVGMGASAGGLEAFLKFFARMPADAGMAFIVLPDLDPRHEPLMPELLGKGTAMRVEQVRDETPVHSDRIYVIPPNATLTIDGGMLRVKPRVEAQVPHMPIDSL